MKQTAIYHYWVFQFTVCLTLVFITRIPYLTGSHFYFDGDEAILGIMAQDLLDGKNLPVYFYGQQYGFSFFEVVAVAIGILFFGSTTFALKFGGMMVFSFGISFLFRLCIRKNISVIVTSAIILIVCCFPAWFLWSMKPRGGYLTAFSCSCILLYIFQTSTPGIKTILIASMILAIGIHSQILVIIPIGFCYAWYLLQSRSFKITMIACVGFVIFALLFKLPAFLNPAYWQAPLSNKINTGNILHLVKQLPELWMGSYFYELVFPIKKTMLITGGIYFLLLLVVVFSSLLRKQKNYHGYIVWLLTGGLISFLLISKISGGLYRYTLGLFTAALLILFLSLIYFVAKEKLYVRIVTGFFAIIGLITAYQQKNIPAFWVHPEKNDQQLYNQLTTHLKDQHIDHVFVLDPMLQWQLNYSGFFSRSVSKKERTNRFTDRVNRCYADSTCKVALVGFTGYFSYTDSTDDWNSKVTFVNERFFVYEGPQDRHLKAGGFE